jgi:hypothetical protein
MLEAERKGKAMQRILAVAAVAVTAAALTANAVADSAYHTEHLALTGLAGAPGGGSVVNIHTNGPTIYAHEIYTLRHVVPGTYQVVLNLFPTSRDCTGPTVPVPTTSITTNAVGNGQGDATFTPEDAAELRGQTFSINWTVTGPATYVSGCTVVVLD